MINFKETVVKADDNQKKYVWDFQVTDNHNIWNNPIVCTDIVSNYNFVNKASLKDTHKKTPSEVYGELIASFTDAQNFRFEFTGVYSKNKLYEMKQDILGTLRFMN